MARLIDADALLKKQTTIRVTYHCQGADEWDDYEVVLVKDINNAPTLSPGEVRGVVKCKDCTFGESATDGDGNPCVLCGNSMVFDYPYAHDPDWFCADGEMK